MSTPTAVLSRTFPSAEDTALSEGLTLADLLEVLGTVTDAGLSAGAAGAGDARESQRLVIRERMQGWTEAAAAKGAGAAGILADLARRCRRIVVLDTRGTEPS